VWIFGCNGLGRTTAEFVIRKGYGRVGLCDPDTVETSNLHRTLWRHDAVGEFKVIQAITELCEVAPGKTELLGYVGTLEETFSDGLVSGATACIVGIDNDSGRAHAATELLKAEIPGIFFALSKDTYTYEVFVQQPGGPCWACAHPDRYVQGISYFETTACPKVPSIADPCLVAVGLCSYALDSLIMNRPRSWNFRQGHLHGELPERIQRLERRSDCPLCGGNPTERFRQSRMVPHAYEGTIPEQRLTRRGTDRPHQLASNLLGFVLPTCLRCFLRSRFWLANSFSS